MFGTATFRGTGDCNEKTQEIKYVLNRIYSPIPTEEISQGMVPLAH
jgi:hypothetical protein